MLVRNDLIMAAGWGVDSTVSEVTRSVYKPGDPPGLRAAPVVADDVRLVDARGVQQGDDSAAVSAVA